MRSRRSCPPAVIAHEGSFVTSRLRAARRATILWFRSNTAAPGQNTTTKRCVTSCWAQHMTNRTCANIVRGKSDGGAHGLRARPSAQARCGVVCIGYEGERRVRRALLFHGECVPTIISISEGSPLSRCRGGSRGGLRRAHFYWQWWLV